MSNTTTNPGGALKPGMMFLLYDVAREPTLVELLRLANRIAHLEVTECRNCNGSGRWRGATCIVCGGVGEVLSSELTVEDVMDAKRVITAAGAAGRIALGKRNTMFNRDFDSPIQDADIEMADLQREAGRLARLRKAGFCDHGWFQGPPGPVGQPTSVYTCHHCGKTFATEAELIEDGRENTLLGRLQESTADTYAGRECPSCEEFVPDFGQDHHYFDNSPYDTDASGMCFSDADPGL